MPHNWYETDQGSTPGTTQTNIMPHNWYETDQGSTPGTTQTNTTQHSSVWFSRQTPRQGTALSPNEARIEPQPDEWLTWQTEHNEERTGRGAVCLVTSWAARDFSKLHSVTYVCTSTIPSAGRQTTVCTHTHTNTAHTRSTLADILLSAYTHKYSTH